MRQRNHLAPDFQVFLITALEFDEFLPRRLQKFLVGFARGVDELVKPLHFGNRIGLERGGVQMFLPADEQFTELRAPVAEVVVGDDAVAEQSQRALERVADAGRTDVADVHRLGYVRRTKINDDGADGRADLRVSLAARQRGLTNFLKK